ncbi:polysaccharide deacetylase family protein, partial [Anaplasma marginale]|uniref:hypothetical protein n=1 Tax=Anaplasma marginale TaxID=770 RepID=UPI0005B3EF4B
TITVNKIINEVVKSRGQDIVLMHDTKRKTVAALESIMINLNRSNVKYMTLSDAFAIEDEHLPHVIPSLTNLNSIPPSLGHIMPED